MILPVLFANIKSGFQTGTSFEQNDHLLDFAGSLKHEIILLFCDQSQGWREMILKVVRLIMVKRNF